MHCSCNRAVFGARSRYPRALFADWTTPSMTKPGPEERPFLWTVPQAVKNILPNSIRRIFKCEKDEPFQVIRNLHIADFFAGKARIARWAELLSLKAVTLDMSYSAHLNFLDDMGLALAVIGVLRIREGGLCFLGPQCSSWVWLCRSITCRSAANPYGDESVECVAEGNRLNQICGLLITICFMCNVQWCIEQPGSSLFFHTRLWRAILREQNPFQRWLHLKVFGHVSQKATFLIGTQSCLTSIGKELSNRAKLRGSRKIGKASPAKAKAKAKARVARVKAKAKAAPKAPTRTKRAPKAQTQKTPSATGGPFFVSYRSWDSLGKLYTLSYCTYPIPCPQVLELKWKFKEATVRGKSLGTPRSCRNPRSTR